MDRHNEQRVGVFADVQNMYYSGKQLYNCKVNFAEILKLAVGNRRLVRAIAYVIKADMEDEKNFHDALNRAGFEVRSKDLQVFFGGAKKGDWDVGIAMDIMRLAPKLDVVVLVSGDGDFVDLLEHVQSMGCRTEVISFKKTASAKLIVTSHQFIELDKYKNLRIPIGKNSSRSARKPPIKASQKPATVRRTNQRRPPMRSPRPKTSRRELPSNSQTSEIDAINSVLD